MGVRVTVRVCVSEGVWVIENVSAGERVRVCG